ncbi:zinc transporter ZntB [Hyphobacterium indicum]|uniref:zinc transporter ZntB n=1 Tax=Hyphobacterium indicum TaxID=2162714 RepID=UPI000D64A2F3|nr:zinc transporter ZntB [Hyphobacterium indicum]
MADIPLLPPVAAYVLDGEGGARSIRLVQLTSPAPGSNGFDFVWVQLQRENHEAMDWLENESGLDGFILDALTADDTRPRCTVHGDGTILNLRGVNLHEGAEPEDMISLRLWVDKHRVIGVWRRPLHAVADLMASLDRGVAPVSPGDLVAKLALRLVDRMEPLVADLHEQMDGMEELLDHPEATFERRILADLRRQTILLRRFIAPQRDALNTLAIEDLDWLTERDRSRIREAGDKTTRVTEELESVRERAAIVHDQLLDLRAEQMHRYTLLLSVVAAIFLPLTLLTGILGINVGGIPGADSPWGFWIVVSGLTLIGLMLLAVFRKLKLI